MPKFQGVVQVAVAVPLRRSFDYVWGSENSENLAPKPVPGTRVEVGFGKRRVVGIIVSTEPPSGNRRLKSIAAVLDPQTPALDAELFNLLTWASDYYHHPLGEVFHAALPSALRKPTPLADPQQQHWLRPADPSSAATSPNLARAPVQARLYQTVCAAKKMPEKTLLAQNPKSSAALRGLLEKGLVVRYQDAAAVANSPVQPANSPPRLNPQQRDAATAVRQNHGRFGSFLLHGITGSGKTEVYLEAAQQCIADGAQVLILVPEIGLTPQLVARVQARLGAEQVCVVHSGLSAKARYSAWWAARSGRASAVLGTRSAVFTPFRNLRLVVVDEEHDLSYKQQDGFRYHARDIAIQRAHLAQIPILLGSATPSMESHHNATRNRHQLLRLDQRVGPATLPQIQFIDTRKHRLSEGVSMPLLRAIGQRLQNHEQSIIFVNRRGFAPVAQCNQCGWQACCQRCDARLTYHQTSKSFRCHYCGYSRTGVLECGECAQPISLFGFGTQRLERFLAKQFPTARICRLDRDRFRSHHQLAAELQAIRDGEIDIIIGTQLITKGHDFAKVTLVGVVDADQGLYSVDFRAAEYLFQQLMQVAGRAGRKANPGKVLLQTAHPEHLGLHYLRQHDFPGFAEYCVGERRAAGYPPFTHLALWRAESPHPNAALTCIRQIARLGAKILAQNHYSELEIMDPVASPMEKLAGRYRAQLLVRSAHRSPLHGLLRNWLAVVENHPSTRRARWSLDIDPMEMV